MKFMNLQQYGKAGWSWTNVLTQTHRSDLRTNSDGQGLFDHDGSGKQLAGTAQFSLPPYDPKQVARVRRMLSNYFCTER